MEVNANTVEQMSHEEFVHQKDEIQASLSEALESIIEDDSFGDDDPPESIRFGMPVVDSKTVMKLSPYVEEIVGIEVNSKWLKKGGYNSSREAIDSVLKGIGSELKVQETVEI